MLLAALNALNALNAENAENAENAVTAQQLPLTSDDELATDRRRSLISQIDWP